MHATYVGLQAITAGSLDPENAFGQVWDWPKRTYRQMHRYFIKGKTNNLGTLFCRLFLKIRYHYL